MEPVPDNLTGVEPIAPLGSRHGDKWSANEYAQLVHEIQTEQTAQEIAHAHGRKIGGIASACHRLLPPELRPKSHLNAPEALFRFLKENGDQCLTIPQPRKAASRNSTETSKLKEPNPQSPTEHEQSRKSAKADSADTFALVTEAIASLDEESRDKFILRSRLGVNTAPQTLQEIGNSLGITRERVRQLQNRALDVLRLQSLRADSPGHHLACLLKIPGKARTTREFAEHVTSLATSQFEAPFQVAILFLAAAAGLSSQVTSELSAYANAVEKKRQEAARILKKSAEVDLRRATKSAEAADRANRKLARWMKDASWPRITADAPAFDSLHALRLRKPGEGVGRFYSEKLGREVAYESGLELTVLTFIERSTSVAWFQEQPFRVPYEWEGEKRTYYPDALIVNKSGTCLLLEVKPYSQIPISINRAKADAGRTFAHQNGWGWISTDATYSDRDLSRHFKKSEHVGTIHDALARIGELKWPDVLTLRNSGVTALDLAAFTFQTRAFFVVEPSYRISLEA